MDCIKTFLKECRDARNDLASVVGQYSVVGHLELRTSIDSLLIMYDQLCQRVKPPEYDCDSCSYYPCVGLGKNDKKKPLNTCGDRTPWEEMSSDQIREMAQNQRLFYRNIRHEDILRLMNIVDHVLSISDNELGMTLCRLRKKDIDLNPDGTIKNCYLMVSGDYFKRREAISFNTPNTSGVGFIGFAGWASTNNTQPFLRAFKIWMDELKTR